MQKKLTQILGESASYFSDRLNQFWYRIGDESHHMWFSSQFMVHMMRKIVGLPSSEPFFIFFPPIWMQEYKVRLLRKINYHTQFIIDGEWNYYIESISGS